MSVLVYVHNTVYNNYYLFTKPLFSRVFHANLKHVDKSTTEMYAIPNDTFCLPRLKTKSALRSAIIRHCRSRPSAGFVGNQNDSVNIYQCESVVLK